MTAITTKAAIKAKLEISDANWDSIIDSLINGAIAFVERHIDKKLDAASVEYTEYFDKPTIILKNPADSITSLKLWDGSAYDLVDADDYRLLGDKQRIDFAFAEGLDKVEVIYEGAGFQEDDLRELVERIVMRQFRKMEHEGENSTVFETATTSWGDIVDDFDKAVLDSHRQTWI